MSEKQNTEKAARTMRHANETGRQDKAVPAQQELQQPDHAKARPPRDHGASNAGEDGGA